MYPTSAWVKFFIRTEYYFNRLYAKLIWLIQHLNWWLFTLSVMHTFLCFNTLHLVHWLILSLTSETLHFAKRSSEFYWCVYLSWHQIIQCISLIYLIIVFENLYVIHFLLSGLKYFFWQRAILLFVFLHWSTWNSIKISKFYAFLRFYWCDVRKETTLPGDVLWK